MISEHSCYTDETKSGDNNGPIVQRAVLFFSKQISAKPVIFLKNPTKDVYNRNKNYLYFVVVEYNRPI